MTTTPQVLKFIVLGDPGVGKTSLLARFCYGRFFTFSSTIGVDFKWHDLVVEGTGESVRLHLWDTAGQEAYRSIAKPYYRQADGVLLVYNAHDPESLDHITDFLTDVRDACPPGAVLALLANKCDLESSYSEESRARGEEFARRNFIPLFYETSALEGTMVHDAFSALARHVLLVKKIHSIGDARLCTVCKDADAHRRCKECQHDFCDVCCESVHNQGSARNHLLFLMRPEGSKEDGKIDRGVVMSPKREAGIRNTCCS